MSFFTTRDQTQIFFTDAGAGAPVVLIHGWPLDADMWEYQKLTLLRSGFRVITYDRRGFGRSDQPVSGYDYNTLADDLSALIDHLQLEKVQLVGFSMGGGEIARYLARHGAEKVVSAALISAVTPYLLKDDSNPEGVDLSTFAQMQSQLEEDRPHFLAAFTKQFFGVNIVNHPVSAETQQWCFSMAMLASLKGTIECVDAFGKTDFRADVSTITIPTLIIHGDADKTVPFETSGKVAARMIPNSMLKVYEGAPHGLFITHKKRLNDDLVNFLQTHAAEIAPDKSHRNVAPTADDIRNRLT